MHITLSPSQFLWVWGCVQLFLTHPSQTPCSSMGHPWAWILQVWNSPWYGMSACKGVSPDAPLLSTPCVSLYISSHLPPHQLLLTCVSRGAMCCSGSFWWVWGCLHGFQSSWNWMTQGSSWTSAQVTSAAPATRPYNLCSLQCSHVNWLDTHVCNNWVFMGKLIACSWVNAAIYVQDAGGLFCHKGTLLVHGQCVHKDPRSFSTKLLSSCWSQACIGTWCYSSTGF